MVRCEAASVAAAAGVDSPGVVLGGWVELRREGCRGGRTHWLLVNRRDRVALTLTPEQAAGFAGDAAAAALGVTDPGFREELWANGFPAGSAPLRGGAAGGRGGLAAARRFARTLDAGTGRAQGLVSAVYRGGARLAFTRAGLLLQVVLAALGAAAFLHAVASPARLQFRAHPGQVPLVLALSLTAIAVHELAHALVVVHHGRRVDVIGFRMHLGTPAFYVESIDGLLLTRRQRMVQALAGCWAEWQVTSLVALWLWAHPSAAVSVLLYRFVVFNTITIASNLLPFTGLDGHLLLADLIGEPDLDQSTRGAAGRVAVAVTARRRPTRREWLLAAYCAINGVVAAVLLGCAVLFWYALFGGVIGGLVHDGPAGWLVLAAAAVVFGRPAVVSSRDRITSAVITLRELISRLRFRSQWRWRIPAVEALVAAMPDLAGLGDHRLGVLAGTARRQRIARGQLLLDGYAHVHRGSATVAGQHQSAGPGAILSPGQMISQSRRGTVLVNLGRPGAPIPAA